VETAASRSFGCEGHCSAGRCSSASADRQSQWHCQLPTAGHMTGTVWQYPPIDAIGTSRHGQCSTEQRRARTAPIGVASAGDARSDTRTHARMPTHPYEGSLGTEDSVRTRGVWQSNHHTRTRTCPRAVELSSQRHAAPHARAEAGRAPDVCPRADEPFSIGDLAPERVQQLILRNGKTV
jgi:hypothetical protein